MEMEMEMNLEMEMVMEMNLEMDLEMEMEMEQVNLVDMMITGSALLYQKQSDPGQGSSYENLLSPQPTASIFAWTRPQNLIQLKPE